jgi:DNA-binding NtrC family response regulator
MSFCFSRADGSLRYCGEAAASLLGSDPVDLRGRHWRDLLGSRVSADSVLLLALQTGARADLPPMLLAGGDAEQVVDGLVLPLDAADGGDLWVVLQPLCPPAEVWPGAADTVALLGVDRLHYDGDWGPDRAAHLMMDLYLSLLQVARASDVVALPRDAVIAILLRDTAADSAEDICTALLSHLHGAAARHGAGSRAARLSIGLASATRERSALGTLVAASDALRRCQLTDSAGRIHRAADDDVGWLAAQALARGGLQADRVAGDGNAAYLAQLTALYADQPALAEYLRRVVGLTLAQPGVAALGFYRYRHDNRLEYVGGGTGGEGGAGASTENALPASIRKWRRQITDGAADRALTVPAQGDVVAYPLDDDERTVGYLVAQHVPVAGGGHGGFVPGAHALYYLAVTLRTKPGWSDTPGAVPRARAPDVVPVETGLEGYVVDNMEGAVDQAVFLAALDVPVAVIGPAGTGKMYIARIVHQQAGGSEETLLVIDCRELRSRGEANKVLNSVLAQAEGKTVVLKSAHLLHHEVQNRLARQLATRTLADAGTPRYLPTAKWVALFPEPLQLLTSQGRLSERLASVFAAYPIMVPPIRDRRRAVLRWAHKILLQESEQRGRTIRGFTPDAEQAMLRHDWPGNISEMRERIARALDMSSKAWITPVDLGIFAGISAEGSRQVTPDTPFLQVEQVADDAQEGYRPTPLEALDVALGELIDRIARQEAAEEPVGEWLDDELVQAVCDRYRGDARKAADFLQTRSRNVSRWLPGIREREPRREASAAWQPAARLARQWARESVKPEQPAQQLLQDRLLSHIERQCRSMTMAARAGLLGVSVPTYQKRLREARARGVTMDSETRRMAGNGETASENG